MTSCLLTPCVFEHGRRAAAKRNKKSGASVAIRQPTRKAASKDVISRSDMEARLGGVPAFGVLAEGAGFAQQGGEEIFYLDPVEAQRQCEANSGFRVEAIPLDSIYFDPTTRLK